jgi:RNA polymerase sigma factor (sigma-70 family)
MEARTITGLPETPDDLLRRAANGDASALEEVARAWRSRIRRWAMYELGNEVLAEDACQDAFVQLIRHIHQYDPSRPFGPWLRTVVRHCCHRVARRNHRHVHEVLEEESVPLKRVSPDPEESAELRQTTRRALEAFTELTPRQREVMHLCSQDGLTAAEAARELGLSPSTARVLMFKARQTLLAALGWSHDV